MMTWESSAEEAAKARIAAAGRKWRDK